MFARLTQRLSRGAFGVTSPLRSTPNLCVIGKFPVEQHALFPPIGGVIARQSFGSYIENYYTTNHASTGFSSPLRKTFAFMIFVFQAVLTFGYLFHTNYYFTGKALPKPDSSTQLCSDSNYAESADHSTSERYINLIVTKLLHRTCKTVMY
ncbi:hypothetical protein X943_003919 [Babesia divergens]|uniref:Uncharacterized protein n=1 Tax=Babesia divergens TaxID=32595 RepID=A0AAD9GK10_BABDI|nr:hypothetical protein X943_003919 [Babesia divergens]